MDVINEKHHCDRCGKAAFLDTEHFNWVKFRRKTSELEFKELYPYICDIPEDLDIAGGKVTFSYSCKSHKFTLCPKCKKIFKEQFKQFMKVGE